MERKNRLVYSCLAGLALACSGPVAAADSSATAPDAGMMSMHGDMTVADCPMMKDGAAGWQTRLAELGVTAEQQMSFQQVAQSYRDRAMVLAQRGSVARDRWMSVLPDDPGYAAATEEAATATAAIAADGIRLAGQMRAEIYALLTPEQRQQMSEKLSSDQQRWDEWRQRHQAAPSE